MSEWDPADAEVLRNLFLDEAEGHLRRIEASFKRLSGVTGYATPNEDLDELFRALHTLKGAAGSVGQDAIASAAHGLEDLCAELRTGTLAPTPGILERLAEELATLKALLEGARQMPLTGAPAEGRVSPSPRLDVPGARDRRQGDRRNQADRRLTVDGPTLERINDAVAEMLIVRTRMERRLRELHGLKVEINLMRKSVGIAVEKFAEVKQGASGDPSAGPTSRTVARLSELELELGSAVTHLDRTTEGLVSETDSLRQTTHGLTNALSALRVAPCEWLFRRLKLALEELQLEAAAPIALYTEGGELEVDRVVLEQLYVPLLHLLRNAIIHGIEPPDERQAGGKPTQGRIDIHAHAQGGFIFIDFTDDGRGIDLQSVRRVLMLRKHVNAHESLSDERLMAALFEPGFSTRTTVDELAGRGMGLNIVKTSVTRLGGGVTCRSSPTLGTGFFLSVPLVGTIVEALLFKMGGQVYLVPASQVVQALPPSSDHGPAAQANLGGSVFLPSGQSLPVLRLQSLFGLEAPPDHRMSLLHLKFGEQEFAMTCDRIVGTRMIVLLSLGPLLSSLPYFAGATVSGTGKVQLVLDVAVLASIAHRTEKLPLPPPRRGPPRVLVVDDSRLAREAAVRAVASLGLQAMTAEDGLEAWELLNERRFDAVVTDLEMPRVDGFQLMARIRRDPTLRRLPLVVLSSRTSKSVQDRARRAGANALVAKGSKRGALVAVLRKLLTETRRLG